MKCKSNECEIISEYTNSRTNAKQSHADFISHACQTTTQDNHVINFARVILFWDKIPLIWNRTHIK